MDWVEHSKSVAQIEPTKRILWFNNHNIADDKQLESLSEMKNLKLFIVDRLEKTIEGFESDDLRRMPFEMNINGETIICQNQSYLDI